jgi:hypothetical protein
MYNGQVQIATEKHFEYYFWPHAEWNKVVFCALESLPGQNGSNTVLRGAMVTILKN